MIETAIMQSCFPTEARVGKEGETLSVAGQGSSSLLCTEALVFGEGRQELGLVQLLSRGGARESPSDITIIIIVVVVVVVVVVVGMVYTHRGTSRL